MCGIAGSVGLRDGNPADVQRAVSLLSHRGPDDVGYWYDERCALGHRRLAIIDTTEGGHQPMSLGASGPVITYNGEIYNFEELRRDLVASGHSFASRSDTEVLLRAYQQWGSGCLSRLRGMFAFAVWEPARCRLFLARDRVGKKPLFWSDLGGQLRFASELQALVAIGDLPLEVDHSAIDQYLSWGYVPAPQSGYRGIQKLPPGHWMEADLSGDQPRYRLERWWHLAHEPKLAISGRDAEAEVRRRVTDAVRARMVSDVPIGAFLSGGIDSSIVVGLMAGLSGVPVKTYSIGFEDARYDELVHARRIAQLWSTDHHEFVVRPDPAILPLLARHYGEPYADSSAIPAYYLSQVARSGVTVALNGDGGDESFAGYDRYRANRIAERIHRTPGLAAATALARHTLPDSADPKSRQRRLHRFLEVGARPMAERYAGWMTYFDEGTKQSIYGEALRPLLGGTRPESLIHGLIAGADACDPVDVAMAVDFGSYLPFDLLVKVDITSMAHGLEARSPFLDHEVMEFAARLPSRVKMRGRRSKRLLLRAFADLLPPENVNRPKMGFGVPVGEWFRGPMRDFLHDALLGPDAAARGYIEPAAAKSMIDSHLAGRTDNTPRLWALLMLELWHREVVDPRSVPRS